MKNIILVHLQNLRIEDGISYAVFNTSMAYNVSESSYYNMHAVDPYYPRHTIELPIEMSKEEVSNIRDMLSKELGHYCPVKHGDEVCMKFKDEYSINEEFRKSGRTELVW